MAMASRGAKAGVKPSWSEPSERIRPEDAAWSAGLRYVSDRTPGIRRLRRPRGFVYIAPGGRPITAEEEILRIRRLAIPPAWSDVWISPSPSGHLQATGRDARRRKQYRYHPRWREVRDATKFHRMVDFGAGLPRIRARVDADLAGRRLSRAAVLATVVRLLDITAVRVGNEEYARENRSFGLTTLRRRHVRVSGSTLRIEFRAKFGRPHQVTVRDRRLVRVVRGCQELPGQQLFRWVDGEGRRHDVDSGDVNAYIREAAGGDFTAKDFRTWTATVLAATALRSVQSDGSETARKRTVAEAVEHVAAQLGNTTTICRRCYIHPEVISAHLEGRTPDDLRSAGSLDRPGHELTAPEAAVVDLLRRRRERRPDPPGPGVRPPAAAAAAA